MNSLVVEHLCKYYEVHHKEPGFIGSIKSLFRRKYKIVKAVDDISFSIKPGEIVGFLGPNGAGKTTTLKILSGLLHPTSGKVSVLGFVPHERKADFLKSITLVMGQKNQLIWDLPPIETFLLNKAIYELSDKEFNRSLSEFSELLELDPLLKKQVRKLSLGERMKCELTAALLHRPSVLFLDEPTIGLDITMQRRIHDFIREYNRRYNATILLTSHYMQDVIALCERILIINKGRILYDGSLDNLVKKIAPYKLLKITFEKPYPRDAIVKVGDIKCINGCKVIVKVPRGKATSIAAIMLNQFRVADLVIEEPSIEEIVVKVFSNQDILPARSTE